MTRQGRQRLFAALAEDKLQCGTCKHWKFYILNQIWGSCKKILYCNDENADNMDLANVTYTYCEGEDLKKPALDHKLALDTAREFGCILWEEK